MNSTLLFLLSLVMLSVASQNPFPDSKTYPSAIRLQDVAAVSGIRASLRCGGPDKSWIPEANGSGTAWLDYDNDGWMDLLIVNGSRIEELRKIVSGSPPKPQKEGVYLYRNLRNGQFQDVTAKAGLFNPYWATGANAADYDNDGFTDILITTIGVDLLFRSNHDGTFSEVGKVAGLKQQITWHTGSAFGDYDGDGNLDLYIAGYVDIMSLRLTAAPPVCHYNGLPVLCGPRGLKGEVDLLYHNNGDGTFKEMTREAGVTDSSAYYGFGAVFDDFDGDGKIDIFVANDSCPNYLYRNMGDGTFKEVGLASSVAFNADGRPQTNMGVAVGDYDNDGKIDALTTTFSEEYFPLFHQKTPGIYEEISSVVGLGTITLPLLGWGCGFTDFDNDGDKDLWTANGHVYPNADKLGTTSYLQSAAIFENREGKFYSIRDLPYHNSYRGAATADFDNDGSVDLVVIPIEGSPLLLKNQTTSQYSWIAFKLEGRGCNRDAIGTKVEIDQGGKKQMDTARNGDSYISRNDPRVHFGLEACTAVDRVVITWPCGKIQVLNDLRVNQFQSVQEPNQSQPPSSTRGNPSCVNTRSYEPAFSVVH
jgi:hypothetical protein